MMQYLPVYRFRDFPQVTLRYGSIQFSGEALLSRLLVIQAELVVRRYREIT